MIRKKKSFLDNKVTMRDIIYLIMFITIICVIFIISLSAIDTSYNIIDSEYNTCIDNCFKNNTLSVSMYGLSVSKVQDEYNNIKNKCKIKCKK